MLFDEWASMIFNNLHRRGAGKRMRRRMKHRKRKVLQLVIVF